MFVMESCQCNWLMLLIFSLLVNHHTYRTYQVLRRSGCFRKLPEVREEAPGAQSFFLEGRTAPVLGASRFGVRRERRETPSSHSVRSWEL